MTGRRKAQLEICKIGKIHGYLGLGYGQAARLFDKIGLKSIAAYLNNRGCNHATVAAGFAIAALELYPKEEDEHS